MVACSTEVYVLSPYWLHTSCTLSEDVNATAIVAIAVTLDVTVAPGIIKYEEVFAANMDNAEVRILALAYGLSAARRVVSSEYIVAPPRLPVTIVADIIMPHVVSAAIA
jgi:hypothetical protein